MKRRILFVDDNTKVLQALERRLYPLCTEWEMRFVGGASEALTLLAQQPCDAIVSDMRMPGMDGAALLAQVHRYYPDTVRIALTGYTRFDTAVRAINEGHISRFLTKPCSVGALTLTIQAALQQQEQEKQKIVSNLVSVGRKMISSLDSHVLIHRLCQLTTKVLECDYSSTFLWQPEQDAYVLASRYGDTAKQWEMGRVLQVPRAVVRELLARLDREEVVQVTSSTGRPEQAIPPSLEHNTNTCLYIALRREEKIIGLHTAGYQDPGRCFTFRQECLARWISQIASLALENARLASQVVGEQRVKEEFLSTLSHELRTPLNVIVGYNGLLLEQEFGPLLEEQKQVLQQVMKSSQTLLDLISAMLDMSCLQKEQLPLEITEVCLPKFLHKLQAELQHAWEKPDLSFGWSIASNLPLVRTDPGKLKVILKNLISNAVKFTDSGSVNVEVSPSKGGVKIQIVDTGIGIAPEVLPVIFEPFRQGDSSLSRRYGGAGFGLYVVRQVLELLGGAIAVESDVGRGSTFRVWVPTERKEK